MKYMIEYLRGMLDMFFRISTGIVFVSAAYITVFWDTETSLDVRILWQILFVALICTIGSVMLPHDDSGRITKSNIKWRMLLYAIFVNIVVMACGFWFEWFQISSITMIIGMEIAIIVVFIVVTAASYLSGYKMAERMNAKLKDRN